jgi:hypothetical protein
MEIKQQSNVNHLVVTQQRTIKFRVLSHKKKVALQKEIA